MRAGTCILCDSDESEFGYCAKCRALMQPPEWSLTGRAEVGQGEVTNV